jgi:hypothetical protein
MKPQKLLIAGMFLLLLACTATDKDPIEGSWKLVSFKWSFPDSATIEYPGNVETAYGSWMLSDTNSLYYYKYRTNADSAYELAFGDMSYKFDGKIYRETYLASDNDQLIGQTFHYQLTIKNDTLTLSGPGEGESEKLGCTVIEKYIRK